MSSYTSEATVSPFIPDSALTEEDLAFLRRFGFQTEQTKENGQPMTYLFAPDYNSSDFDGDDEVTEDDLASTLMGIIKRSKGKLTHLYVSIAYTCSRYEPDSFGGGAIFVTARSCRFTSTANWISRQIEKLHKAAVRSRKGNDDGRAKA